MKTFNIFWNDLTEECQQRLYEFLENENGNYYIFPIAELSIEEEEQRNKVQIFSPAK